jgi:hypothetical protein
MDLPAEAERAIADVVYASSAQVGKEDATLIARRALRAALPHLTAALAEKIETAIVGGRGTDYERGIDEGIAVAASVVRGLVDGEPTSG